MSCICTKCGETVSGFNGKMVMLREDLWLSLTHKKDVLCDMCIEQALGRSIQVTDLKMDRGVHIPVNELYMRRRGVLLNKEA